MTGRTLVTARSLRALDWLNFFVANVQTGFGPFIASYLASHKWTQGEIGMALSVGTISAMVSQVPGGAAVDALRNKKAAAAWACLGDGAAMFPRWLRGPTKSPGVRTQFAIARRGCRPRWAHRA